MFKLNGIEKMDIEQKYKYMLILLRGQLDSEKDTIANLSNASAIIKSLVDKINWAGFYLIKKNELVLGPFQGKPACNRIQVGKGVCGTAVLEKKVLSVTNVNEFPGHIACDCESKSEIVVPIISNDKVYGVLDIDSPEYSRFSELDEKYLTKFVQILEKNI